MKLSKLDESAKTRLNGSKSKNLPAIVLSQHQLLEKDQVSLKHQLFVESVPGYPESVYGSSFQIAPVIFYRHEESEEHSIY